MFLNVLIFLYFVVNAVTAQRDLHQRWEDQLQRYVTPTGGIHYSDWKKEEHALRSYIQALQDHPPQQYWTPTNRKAYWINAYNAATIALVLKHYPLSGIREINAPWETSVFRWKDQSLSLKAIESLLLEMGDPRILFALHRAAVSSPLLSKQAYRSHTLEDQLEAAAIQFLNDPCQNQCQKDTPRLSRIFLWYFKDFGSFEKRLALLKKYGCTGVDQKTKFLYLPFDWRLNDLP